MLVGNPSDKFNLLLNISSFFYSSSSHRCTAQLSLIIASNLQNADHPAFIDKDLLVLLSCCLCNWLPLCYLYMNILASCTHHTQLASSALFLLIHVIVSQIGGFCFSKCIFQKLPHSCKCMSFIIRVFVDYVYPSLSKDTSCNVREYTRK